jgi:hypothetical protein
MTQDVPTLWSEYGIISDVVVRSSISGSTLFLKSQFVAVH